MFAEERHALILTMLNAAGRVEVSELVARLQVSSDTVRRDLREMAALGLINKTHGGAVSVNGPSMPALQRRHLDAPAKDGIGIAAARLVQPHQSVIIDAGATGLSLARHVSARPLRVVTNAFDIAALLCDDADIELIVLGGAWNRHDRNFTGEAALKGLALIRADWAFIGACGLDAKAGITAQFGEDAQLKRAMLASAARSVVLADSRKLGLVAPYFVADLAELDHLVTDIAPDTLDGADIHIIVGPASTA